MNKVSRNYYLNSVKIIRDLVHNYINLTEFDLKIIDTLEFQRLKDIRQLTCQNVYPSARHTRFEHSLGVLELTRKAIKYLNRNGIINKKSKIYIDDNLTFNVSLAALLHDVGHCPFSHMGEIEFNEDEVRNYLYESMKECNSLKKSKELLAKIEKGEKIGAVHEQLSCIVILEKFSTILNDISKKPINADDECEITVDYELIIRCILGIEYNVSTEYLFRKNALKNTLVKLINSKIFDMDKLDYVMRDSLFTGIGAPLIDTGRMFKNMYLGNDYNIIFTSKAVPALQNLIDVRDGLYMYVYNHHAVIFSDFLNTYILRRLSHNAQEFVELTHPDWDKKKVDEHLEGFQISRLGLIPKPYLFSVGAIIEGGRSDSDWLSLLNIINTNYTDDRDSLEQDFTNDLINYFSSIYQDYEDYKNDEKFKAKKERLLNKILVSYKLIYNYKTRNFLKPWWKTVFEFTNFMEMNFPDDFIRSEISKLICYGDDNIDAAEFRSQIVKHVSYITQHCKLNNNIIEPLQSEDMFIIERSNRFFSPDIIEKLQIAIKTSELTTSCYDNENKIGNYYIKKLTNIIPQKDYSSIYSKEGFYIFSKIISKNKLEQEKHFTEIVKIFVFVSTELVKKGRQRFAKLFGKKVGADKKHSNEIKSYQEMLNSYNCYNQI